MPGRPQSLVQSPSRTPGARYPARLAALAIAFLLALGAWSEATLVFYVDSVEGSDAAAGTSPETAFATLARVRPLIANGATVRLKRGSLFRDHLSLGNAPFIGLSIEAYGDGPRPIIDGSDIVPPAGWAPAEGGTLPGVFETVVTTGALAAIDIVQVVENGRRLPRVATLAECATQPGSSFDELVTTGNYRVYVHPTTSALEDRLLAVARRDCIRISGDNHRIDDLHLRNAVTGTGTLGIFEGDNFQASNLLLENGTRHHMVVSNGTFRNCTFYNLQSPVSFPSVYSLYRTEIGGAWIEFYDSTFLQDLRFATAAEVAVAHGAGSSVGAPSHGWHHRCRFFNFVGPGGISASGYFRFENCLLSNVRNGFRSHRVQFLNSTWLGDRLDETADFFLSGSAAISDLQVRDSFIDSFRFLQAPVAETSRIEIRSCQILARAGLRFGGIPGTFIFENNVIDADWFLDVYNSPIPDPVAWTITSNQFHGGLSFNRGTPTVLYPDGDYLYTNGEHHRLSQWLIDRGQCDNTFLLQASRRSSSFADSPALKIARGEHHLEVSCTTQLGASYQLSTSTDMGTWIPSGPARPGNGRELYWMLPLPAERVGFFVASGRIP